MDIYQYIDSKDMREHLKSLDYQFTAAEAAWIVDRKEKILLKDKLSAWKEIIDTMPDCELPMDIPELGKIGTHELLQEYIAVQQKMMDIFFCEEENTNYEYCGSAWPNFARALKESAIIISSAGQNRDGYPVISKKWNCTEKYITALVNMSGEIVNLWYCVGVLDGEHEEAVYTGMYDMDKYMDCTNPMPSFPYVKGDVLQHIFDDEGIVVDHINRDGIVCGYMFIVTDGAIRPYVYAEPWNCFMYERCDEEKAQRVRRAFKAEIARMQDICKEWE